MLTMEVKQRKDRANSMRKEGDKSQPARPDGIAIGRRSRGCLIELCQYSRWKENAKCYRLWLFWVAFWERSEKTASMFSCGTKDLKICSLSHAEPRIITESFTNEIMDEFLSVEFKNCWSEISPFLVEYRCIYPWYKRPREFCILYFVDIDRTTWSCPT